MIIYYDEDIIYLIAADPFKQKAEEVTIHFETIGLNSVDVFYNQY